PMRATGTEVHLGQTCGIGVIEEIDPASGALADDLRDLRTDPALIEVGGELDSTVADDAGKAAADGKSVDVGSVGDELELQGPVGDCFGSIGYRFGYGFRGAGPWLQHVQAFERQLPGDRVHQGRLDAGSADVDADGEVVRGSRRHLSAHRSAALR